MGGSYGKNGRIYGSAEKGREEKAVLDAVGCPIGPRPAGSSAVAGSVELLLLRRIHERWPSVSEEGAEARSQVVGRCHKKAQPKGWACFFICRNTLLKPLF